MNYTDDETPFTRVVEHKHFSKDKSDVTWISKEYPSLVSNEKFYPVNDKRNNQIYRSTKKKQKRIQMYFLVVDLQNTNTTTWTIPF
jgi:UDP-galactopyranose mutase